MAGGNVNFQSLNAQSEKKITVAVQVEGLPFYLTSGPLYSTVRYGDPGHHYGEANLYYGKLLKRTDTQSILSLEGSSLTLSQRIEPESGKGAVATLSLAFIDKNEIMSQIIASQGGYLTEILGKNVNVFLGYQESVFPDDYFIIFHGFITQVDSKSGTVVVQFSDPNLKRRQNIFFSAKTTLLANIDAVTTTIPVVSTGSFNQFVMNTLGQFDPAVRCFIKIDDEFMEYTPTTVISPTSLAPVSRGSNPLAPLPPTANRSPAAHTAGTDVQCFLMLGSQLFPENAMDMALKIMLSGNKGNPGNAWITGVAVRNIGIDPSNNPAPLNMYFNVDVVETYGLVIGDQITVSGSVFPGNNKTCNIVDFLNEGDQLNRIVITDQMFTADAATAATLAFRSQFDAYPDNAGLNMTPQDVDVQGHTDLRDTFLSDPENSYSFLIDAQEVGKTFIETELYVPMSCYSLTRLGKNSVQITKPPLAAAGIVTINQHNLLEPIQTSISRGLNTRKFFNEIDISYDLLDDLSTFASEQVFLDSNSLTVIGVPSTLPIVSKGLKSFLSTDIQTFLNEKADYLLSRYKNGAQMISCKVNWQVANQIEAGDVVLVDGTNLNISNPVDGTRNLGMQLFEVINRSLDFKNGVGTLQLVSGVGSAATDRFASIGPSSFISAVTALPDGVTYKLIVTDSFTTANPKFPAAEGKKWQNMLNQVVSVRNPNYTPPNPVQDLFGVITSYDPNDVNTFFISTDTTVYPFLQQLGSFPPPSVGDLIQMGLYQRSDVNSYFIFGGFTPAQSDAAARADDLTFNRFFFTRELFFAFQTIYMNVLAGSTNTVLNVDPRTIDFPYDPAATPPGRVPAFNIGTTIRIFNDDFSMDSGEVKIVAFDPVAHTITVPTLTFTPGAGFSILVYRFSSIWPNGDPPYRWI